MGIGVGRLSYVCCSKGGRCNKKRKNSLPCRSDIVMEKITINRELMEFYVTLGKTVGSTNILLWVPHIL